jgi:hypothetical protein
MRYCQIGRIGELEMRIRKVQLEGDVDEFGGRALAVSTTSDVGTIRTPNRALTSTEFQYKAKLPFSPALNNDVSEIVHQLHGKRWTQFMNTNGSFYNIKKSMDSFAAKMAYTVKRYYPQIKFGTPISDEAIHQMIMLQRSEELDFISMPSIPPTSQMFEKTATSFIEEVLSENEEPMVYLDMGLDPKIFQERFSALLEFVHTGEIHSIGLIYRSWHKYIRNYEYLWKNREVEVFLFNEYPAACCGVFIKNNLHEYYCSTDEFKQSRKYIIGGELKCYFKSKNGLKSSDIPISKTILDF